ncbi:MAG: Carbohydrate binding family 25 [Polyangiaceae bacterium]|nr:Carbohydrate binding family 25 [Polyangiaceae bacterium]
MPYGVVSCQPAFETACKPTIVFENQDPNGKGKIFTNAVPDVETTMKDIACTACSILYRDPSEIPDEKHPSTIKLVLDTHGGVAQAGGGQIQFDLNYIDSKRNDSPESIKQEMLGVLQHETVHLYQNYGTAGTGEGLADLVRARTGFYPKSRWRSEGDWKAAYTASGNFYSWLTGPCTFHTEAYAQHDFDLPYKINKVLAGKSGDASFDAVAGLLQMTFGKNVEQLWDEYQADAYGK